MLIRVLALFVCFFMASAANAEVWKTTSTWDDAYELKYSRWVEQSFVEKIFVQGDWAGIETDCADAIYAARIIFAYLNGLPFSVEYKGSRFSNSSYHLDRIQDPLLRVKIFIELVNERTWTGSLAQHTYPIAIDRRSIVPGVVWLKPGHAELVSRVRDSGVVELRGSWLPGAVREMITVTSLGYIPSNANVGFRRWIWPQNSSQPLRKQPGYDNSQIQAPIAATSALARYFEIAEFEDKVHVKLALDGRVESSKSKLDRLAKDFCSLVRARSEVVNLGYGFAEKSQRCLTAKEYYAYSTPGRDSNLRRVVFDLGLQVENDLGQVAKALESCKPIPVSRDLKSGRMKFVQPAEFLKKLLTLDFSSDPHQKPTARFGLEVPEKICVGPDGIETDNGS